MNWLITLIFNWIAKRLGYVPDPTKAAPPINIEKEKVEIIPDTIKQHGGNPSGGAPAATKAHGE